MIWSKFFSLWPNESSQSARPSLIDVFVRTGVGVGAMGPGGLHFKRRIDSDDKNFQDNWKEGVSIAFYCTPLPAAASGHGRTPVSWWISMSTDDVPHPLIHRSTLQNSDLSTSSFLSSPRTSTRVLIGSGLRSSVVISSFSLSASLSIQILLQRFAKSTSDHYRKIPSSFPPTPYWMRGHKQRPSICIKRFSASGSDLQNYQRELSATFSGIRSGGDNATPQATSTTYILSVRVRLPCPIPFRFSRSASDRNRSPRVWPGLNFR